MRQKGFVASWAFDQVKAEDLEKASEELIEKTFEEIRKSTSLPKPFKTFQYDSMKVSLILNNAA